MQMSLLHWRPDPKQRGNVWESSLVIDGRIHRFRIARVVADAPAFYGIMNGVILDAWMTPRKTMEGVDVMVRCKFAL